MRGAGRVVFAAIMLMIVGTINIIYGIGALDDANIFVNDTRFVLDDLNTLGWVLIVLGVIQLTAGFSLIAGNTYGRVIGIIAGSLGAIGALFSIGGSNPWWSLAVFALCVWIVYGILVFGEDERSAPRSTPGMYGPRSRASAQRNAPADARAFAGQGLDRQLPADRLDPVPHVGEPGAGSVVRLMDEPALRRR